MGRIRRFLRNSGLDERRLQDQTDAPLLEDARGRRADQHNAIAIDHRDPRGIAPGGAIGIIGWLLASIGLRAYLHFFNSYTAIYGSLGAVIILLTWFYLSGLMLLLGGEVDSEIEAAATERRLAALAEMTPMP